LLLRTYVAHGSNTGDLNATRFGNAADSHQTSLGLYRVGQTIVSPKHGAALLLEGLDKSLNGMARAREMIIHGADYVSDSFIAFATGADTTAPVKGAFPAHLTGLYEQLATGDTTLKCEGCTTDLELHLTAEFFRFAARNYSGYTQGDLRELNWFIPRTKKNAG